MKDNITSSYWSLVWQRFKKNKAAKWSYRIFILLLWIALLNPFIAGDVPIYAKINGESSFPVLKQYLIDLGLASKTGNFQHGSNWHDMEYEAVIKPIIPYSATYRDTRNIHFKSPFGHQNMKKSQAWHYLGTDNLGRDVAAGMVAGVRVALKVGLFSMLIATIIGIFMGAIAGYFGDNKLKWSISALILNSLAFFIAIHFAYNARTYALFESDNIFLEILKSLGIAFFIFAFLNLFSQIIQSIFPPLQKKVIIPIDIIIMRIVEIMNSIPGLLIIIAIAAIFSTKSLWVLIFIIGLIRWTGITRFLRAELLKVKNLEYITAAKALGFTDQRILFKHAIPNAIGPVLIVIAFGIASSILAEATLAFLGIGTDLNRISWGTLLHYARGNEAKWWLAVFPGLAIFITVTIFNLIGEGLKDALDAKDI